MILFGNLPTELNIPHHTFLPSTHLKSALFFKSLLSLTSSMNPPLTSPPYWHPGLLPYCELRATHVCTMSWLLHHTLAYQWKQLVNEHIWFMTTLDNQLLFLFTFV